eukprot:233322-Pyramimonas_sp.AAC.1
MPSVPETAAKAVGPSASVYKALPDSHDRPPASGVVSGRAGENEQHRARPGRDGQWRATRRGNRSSSHQNHPEARAEHHMETRSAISSDGCTRHLFSDAARGGQI